MTPNYSPPAVARIVISCLTAHAMILSALVGTAQAARVAAPKLLPKSTYFYLQVANVPELVGAFQQTNLGRMIADPQIKPFVKKLYDSVGNAMEQLKDRTGFSVDELASIPKGEITLAAMPAEGQQVAMVFIVDCGDAATTKKLIGAMGRMLDEDGQTPREDVADGVTLYVGRQMGPMQFVYFEHESAVVATSTVDSAKQLLQQWNDGAKESLADNARFQSIMNRCRGTKDEPPQIVFFTDPLEWLWDSSKFSPGLQFGLRLLPALGLDGFKGVGGSMVLASEDFDSILHVHVLLDSPRSGVLDAIALDSGDDTPPHWVPDDVNQYRSFHADFKQAVEKATKLADSFRGLEAGTTAGRLDDRAKSILGIHVADDLLPAITGRIVHINRFVEPPRAGVGPSNLVAIELRDAIVFGRAYEKVIDHFIDRFEKHPVASVNYYRRKSDSKPSDEQPIPCFAMVDNWIFVGDQPWMMEYILNQRDETANRLSAALDFKLIASKIARQPGGDRPTMMSYERTEAGFKYLYDLANSERAKARLRDLAAGNGFLKALSAGLSDNPLPPWTALSKYLAPQGGMLVNDDSGIHLMRFSLRRK
ncbi:MAG: hypothetical protein IT427_17415 [Pirellulales bacterium]|nr:hypothetical protein [Pirellulales bacterium]